MMAKMNKTEALNTAKRMAREHVDVNALTVEQIEALDYAEKRARAEAIMLTTAVGRIDTHDRYIADCRCAFVDSAMNTWGNKVNALRSARRSFASACDGLTITEANAKVVELLSSMHIRGARIENGRVEVTRGDRDGATLYWRFDRDDDTTVNPDDATHRVNRYRVRVEISTSGTTYTLSRMALVHKIHGELLDAAHEIEATLSALRVISVWGGKVEEPVEAAPATSLTNEQVEKISADMSAALAKVQA